MESDLSTEIDRPPGGLDAQLLHDLRNPLGAIHAAARLLIRSKRDPEYVQQMAEAIRSEVDTLLRLLDERYESGLTMDVEQDSEAQASRSMNVLIADDNQESARTLAMCLQLEGHKVSVAYTAEQALQLADSERPEVIVLDVCMPTKNGYQVAQELRQRAWGSGTKLIAVSGLARVEDQEHAFAAGFDAYMTKPVDIDRLNSMLTI